MRDCFITNITIEITRLRPKFAIYDSVFAPYDYFHQVQGTPKLNNIRVVSSPSAVYLPMASRTLCSGDRKGLF